MITLNDGGKKRPFLQKILPYFTMGYFVVLAILTIFLYRASPGPDAQEILGVGIGRWQNESGIAFFSGRRLDCSEANDSSQFSTLCRITIAEKTLEIYASRNEPSSFNQLNGRCEAYYDGKQWPCSIGSRHVDVHWFAFIDSPLGLSKAQLDSLRRHYFFENLGEEPFLFGGLITAVFTTILIIANYLLHFWHKTQVKYLLFLTAVPITVVTFYGSALFAVWITRGFWD